MSFPALKKTLHSLNDSLFTLCFYVVVVENIHKCQEKCHEGPCGPCDDVTTIRCRCDSKDKDFPCKEVHQFTEDNPFTCERRCNKKRSCGRHKCGQLCCVVRYHYFVKCVKMSRKLLFLQFNSYLRFTGGLWLIFLLLVVVTVSGEIMNVQHPIVSSFVYDFVIT